MHDAVLVRARSGRGQQNVGLAPLVIGSRAFAVYPPERAEPVSGALARFLALSLALFRGQLSREPAAPRAIAFPFPLPRALFRGRVQPRDLLSPAVVCTLLFALFWRHSLACFTLQNSALLTPPRLGHFDIGSV